MCGGGCAKVAQTMDTMLEKAAAAGKKFMMSVNDAWYIYSFYAGAGLVATLAEDGSNTVCNWNEAPGADVTQAILDITANPGFKSGADADIVSAIKDGSSSGGVHRAIRCGQGQGAVPVVHIGALGSFDPGIVGGVVISHREGAVLHQVDVAAQPAACILLGQLHEQAVLCFFRCCGALGGLGSGCALRGSCRSRCAAAAEEHGPEHQCLHGSDAHADTGLCALAQLFTGGDALEDQQRDGNKQDAVHDGQQDEPVGGVLLGGNGLCACSLAVGAGGGQSALPVGAGNVLLDTKIENYLSNFEKDFAFGSPQTVTPVPHPAPSSR